MTAHAPWRTGASPNWKIISNELGENKFERSEFKKLIKFSTRLAAVAESLGHSNSKEKNPLNVMGLKPRHPGHIHSI